MLGRFSNEALSENILFEIARGSIPGFTSITITGNNPSVGTVLETIWDESGLYVYPPTPLQFTISSVSNDDTANGTGARAVFIIGLDAEGNWQTEISPTNGQAGILTEKTYSRINVAYNVSAGSAGRNLGKMYIGTGALTAGVPATVYGSIDGTSNTRDNTMKQTPFTIPKGYVGYVTGFVVGLEAAKEGTLSIFHRVQNQLMRGEGELILYQSPLQISLSTPFRFPALTDIELRGFATTGDLFLRANMTVILERVDETVPFILPGSLLPSEEWVV